MTLLASAGAISTAFVSAGFGAIVAPLLFGVPERRRVRGEAAKAISKLEFTRFADESRTWREFEEAVHQFHAAALIALIPREVTEEYIFLARSGRVVGEMTLKTPAQDEHGETVYEALVHPIHEKCIKDAYQLAADALWKPFRSRFKREQKLSDLRTASRQLCSAPLETGYVLTNMWRKGEL